jgi:hypothetical protein
MTDIQSLLDTYIVYNKIFKNLKIQIIKMAIFFLFLCNPITIHIEEEDHA